MGELIEVHDWLGVVLVDTQPEEGKVRWDNSCTEGGYYVRGWSL